MYNPFKMVIFFLVFGDGKRSALLEFMLRTSFALNLVIQNPITKFSELICKYIGKICKICQKCFRERSIFRLISKL